jgi:hypothetical protein
MCLCLVLCILVLDQFANVSVKCVLYFEVMVSKLSWRPNAPIYDAIT